MKKNKLNQLIIDTLGVASISLLPSVGFASSWYDVPIPVTHNQYNDLYNWEGVFRLLDSQGAPLRNTSNPTKGANLYETAISGTMLYQDWTGTANVAIQPFDFFSGSSQLELTSFNLWAAGDGLGGPGNLMLGNMLFDWDGTSGIPASIILDASGFAAGELTAGGTNSAIPASDGTYTDGTFGYMNLGPVPIATTAYNTSLASTIYGNCQIGVDTNYLNNDGGGCMGNEISGYLPLIYDNASYEYPWTDNTVNTGGTIGGSPMPDGPFTGYSINLEISNMSLVPYPEVPIPAAAWLFGSGLLGLLGIAKRRKS